jgi:hypothetical protein
MLCIQPIACCIIFVSQYDFVVCMGDPRFCHFHRFVSRLCDESAGSCALVPPGWWERTDGLVVAGETMNAGLNKNEAELRILVLAIALKMLADSDSLTNVSKWKGYRRSCL